MFRSHKRALLPLLASVAFASLLLTGCYREEKVESPNEKTAAPARNANTDIQKDRSMK